MWKWYIYHWASVNKWIDDLNCNSFLLLPCCCIYFRLICVIFWNCTLGMVSQEVSKLGNFQEWCYVAVFSHRWNNKLTCSLRIAGAALLDLQFVALAQLSSEICEGESSICQSYQICFTVSGICCLWSERSISLLSLLTLLNAPVKTSCLLCTNLNAAVH